MTPPISSFEMEMPERLPSSTVSAEGGISMSTAPIAIRGPVAMVGAHHVVGRRRVAVTLIANVVRRPKVSTKVGRAIDVRALMNIGPATEPTNDEVRHAADLVMRQLVDLIEDLRGQTAPDPIGVPGLAD